MDISVKLDFQTREYISTLKCFFCPVCAEVWYKSRAQLEKHIKECTDEDLDEEHQKPIVLCHIYQSYINHVFKEKLHQLYLETSQSYDDLIKICDDSFKQYCFERNFVISTTELYLKTYQFVYAFFDIPPSFNKTLIQRISTIIS